MNKPDEFRKAQQWGRLVATADEWLIVYSLPPDALTSVKLFSVGHALELYLKAARIKQGSTLGDVIGKRHRIADLLHGCQRADEAFLPALKLRVSLVKADVARAATLALTEDDRAHLSRHYEFYLVANYLADLKYLYGALKPPLGGPDSFHIGYRVRNPYWIDLFGALRRYLGHPALGAGDVIRDHLLAKALPPESAHYLLGLYPDGLWAELWHRLLGLLGRPASESGCSVKSPRWGPTPERP